MAHVEDPHLAVEIHQGDDKAMAHLMRKYEDMLYTYAYNMIGQEDDARDVLQDTFIKVHETLSTKYDESTCRDLALKSWLFRITRNTALNKLRTVKRRGMREKKMSDELNFTPPSSPDTLTSLSISKALERLDRKGRELITLRFIDGLSYAEMGSILDTGEAALRGKIYRVLRKLRKIMEESSDDL